MLRFNTIGSQFPVWVVRTVQQGPESVPDDHFTLLIRGDVDPDGVVDAPTMQPSRTIEMTDLTVKYFSSGMTGAPQIANNWGDLVTMLDACLVNGFALKAIDTLDLRRWRGHATITAGTPIGHFRWSRSLRAEQPEYNGSFRVLTTTTTTFTYAVTGTPVSPATTPRTSRPRSPLGWEKPFAGTSKAAYRSKNPQSPQNILLIDNSLKTPNLHDDLGRRANVGIVEDLSDIDTIVGAQAPTTRTTRRRTGSRSGQPVGWYKMVPRHQRLRQLW